MTSVATCKQHVPLPSDLRLASGSSSSLGSASSDQHSFSPLGPPRQYPHAKGACRKRSRPCQISPSASDSDEGSTSSSVFSFASSSQSLLAGDDSPATSSAGSSPYFQGSAGEDDAAHDGRALKSKKICCSRPSSVEPSTASGIGLDATHGVCNPSSQIFLSASSVTSEHSDADVATLGGAVQAFDLSDKKQSPASQPSPATPAVKFNLADHLVDAAVTTIDAIWHSPLDGIPDSAMGERCKMAEGIPLPLFVRETLRRSRTSCSVLQAALLYCVKSGPKIRAERYRFLHMAQTARGEDESLSSAATRISSTLDAPAAPLQVFLLCHRRFFLAALISATKFLQDKNFSNRAWSKITGLPVQQLGKVERIFLETIDWNLTITLPEWEEWTRKLAEFKGTDAAQRAQPTAGEQVAPLPATPTTPTAPQATPIAKPGSALPDSVLRLRRSPSPSCRRSGSCTPTPPAAQRSCVSAASSVRSLLSRSHSDDSAFLAFDSAIQAPPTPDAHKAEVVAPVSAPSAAAPESSLPAPFPMHRTFVRSALSFSAGTGTAGCDRLSALKMEHHQ